MGNLSWQAMTVAAVATALVLAACGSGKADSCVPPPITDDTHRELHPGLVATLHLKNNVPCQPLPSGYRVEQVVTGLDFPIALAFTPDGRILVTERVTGKVQIVDDGNLQAEPFVMVEGVWAHLADGLPSPAAGLLGIAVDPEFESNHYVYVYFTEVVAEGNNIVIMRYTERDGRGTDPRRILDGVPGDPAGEHLGGNMEFGPDGKLYVAMGDTCGRAVPGCGGTGEHPVDLAQDLSSPAGSLLRLNPDGSAPDDNPLVDDPEADHRIFAYGLRNVFDFAFHPTTRDIIAADNGPATDDEINILRAGGDYGWPAVQGQAAGPPFTDPILVYHATISPAGMDAYDGVRLQEFANDVFFCQFKRGGLLHRLRLAPPVYDTVASDEIIAGGCTSGVQTGPDGLLYFMDLVSGTIYRITDGEEPNG